MLLLENPNIVSLNETKTNATTCSYLYELSRVGYYPFIKNRINEKGEETCQGGGVALLIKDSIISKPIKFNKELDPVEIVGAEILFGGKTLNILSLYVPPDQVKINQNITNFLESLDDFILLGDLNAKISNFGPTNALGRSLENWLRVGKGFIVNEPNMSTYYKYKKVVENDSSTTEKIYESTLDLIIANDRIKQTASGFTNLPDSSVINKDLLWYHAPIKCSFKININKKKKGKSFHSSYLYDKAKWPKFQNDIEATLENENFENKTLNEVTGKIFEAISTAASNNIPKSKENSKRLNNYPANIRDALNSRNFWKREFQKYRTEYSAKKLKEYEETVNILIGKFKLKQWQNFLDTQGKSPLSSVPFWRRINRLRACKRNRGIAELKVNDIKISESKAKADVFAESLSKKFSLEENVNFNDVLKKEIDEKFSDTNFKNLTATMNKKYRDFSYDELTGAIKSMNSKTSLDGLGISNKMLKVLGPKAKNIVLDLFNKCLNENSVPTLWKHSIITMILKSGQESDSLNSYRPISTTPYLARLFERMVLHRLNIHLKTNNIIIANQSGFRRNRQTQDNLLYIIQNSQEAFNCDEKAHTIFFDVAAAFDKVWHNGLLHKLVEMKVPFYLIAIIKSFLDNRTFVVKVDGKESAIHFILCGVPQGGVLSPTLFSIYINNIPLASGEKEVTLLFADDLVYQLRYKYKKKGRVNGQANLEARATVQAYLNTLEKWMNDWHLALAPKKCGQLTFSRSRGNENDEELDVRLYGEKIPLDKNPKFLGIHFDRRLMFEKHFELVDKKLVDRMNILKILSYDKNWRLDTNTLVRIYKSLVRSVLDYACVTSISCNKDVVKRYEILQNDALRIVFKRSVMDHVRVEDLRKWAGVTSIEDRHKELLLRYYERAIISDNPLLKKLFVNYKKFKERSFLNPDLAVNAAGVVNLETLEFIRNHNRAELKKTEKYGTTLCGANDIIKEFILDDYAVGGRGLS